MSADTTVEQVMHEGSSRLSPAMPIREAVALFIRQRIPSAPVIDEAGALVGILTEKDCFGPMLKASYYQQWTCSPPFSTSPNRCRADGGPKETTRNRCPPTHWRRG